MLNRALIGEDTLEFYLFDGVWRAFVFKVAPIIS